MGLNTTNATQAAREQIPGPSPFSEAPQPNTVALTECPGKQGELSNGDVFHPDHPCQQVGPLLARAANRIPPPVRIDAPTGKRAVYPPDSLRGRVAAWVDEHGLDLAAPLSASDAARIARELSADPQAIRVAVQHVRQGRGIKSRPGGGGIGRKVRRAAEIEAARARVLAVETLEKLLAAGTPECLVAAAPLAAKLLDSYGSGEEGAS